jgi:hypothetical protein
MIAIKPNTNRNNIARIKLSITANIDDHTGVRLRFFGSQTCRAFVIVAIAIGSDCVAFPPLGGILGCADDLLRPANHQRVAVEGGSAKVVGGTFDGAPT